MKLPPLTEPGAAGWQRHYRLVASQFPPVRLFEDYVDPDLAMAAYEVEARTNARLRAEAGDLTLVAREDYLFGPGATPVMAAFTHIHRPSRFTDGSFGIYYAANNIETALVEVRFHRERFMRRTHEPPNKLIARSYVGRLQRSLHDIRGRGYARYLNPDIDTWPRAQVFSSKIRATGSWGLLYRSVRNPRGECAAFYRPPAVGIPSQGKHYVFYWNGDCIAHTYELKEIRQ